MDYHELKNTKFEPENTSCDIRDLFSGTITIDQALHRLRTRLLDLSSRNRLISFRYPKGRSIQFTGALNLNLVYGRIADGKSLLIKYVPDPLPLTYTQKKPDVKTHAKSLGIDTAVDFSPKLCVPSTNKHTPKLQALYYPTDLDKLCRKIASESRTVIEETGTNMLYLIFGFLEFYDRDDSERPMYAPLLSVPVTLERGGIDEDTRTYQYLISYSGEDIHENQTLREKLSQDFLLQLPDFEDEDEPSSYFSKITNAVKNKNRWNVRYQLTLGFLSFGKLAIWDDLDPKKSPGLLSHPLLNVIFSGGSGMGAGDTLEDYEIDKHPQGELPLIYDADSSQHSAIIDVLAGKNMVINGPPGTGKSQTITNIIAAGLKAEKKILFISEKLAALEVVRHRLNQANLGHFCLELHSHKTQKKKLLSELKDRLDEQFVVPSQLKNKLVTLNRHKKTLNRYAELISSVIGNELGLTVYDIFWKIERHRQSIGELANSVQTLYLTTAKTLSYDEIQFQRGKLEVLGKLFNTIGKYDSSHPWWGFTPRHLAPGDDEAIGRIVINALCIAEALMASVNAYMEEVNVKKEPTLDFLRDIHTEILAIPAIPNNIIGELLPRIFSDGEQKSRLNIDVIAKVCRKVENAKILAAKAESLLVPECILKNETAKLLIESCSKDLELGALTTPLACLSDSIDAAERALDTFHQVFSGANYAFIPIKNVTLETLNARVLATLPLVLKDQTADMLREGVVRLQQEICVLKQALSHVSKIAQKREIVFDSSPESVLSLGRGDGICEVLPGVLVDNEVITRAKQASEYYLSDLSIAELNRRHQELRELHDFSERVLQEVDGVASTLGFKFDGTQKSLTFLATIAMIASKAPPELLDYRHSTLATSVVPELLSKARSELEKECMQRDALSNDFYLDSLPNSESLKGAIRTFRTGDSFFNIFNSEWRRAKKLYDGISKSKGKKSAEEREKKFSNLVAWIEHRQSILSNSEYKRVFGPLYQGLDTDFKKIQKLHAWYTESQEELLKHPGFIESVDLTMIGVNKLNQLAVIFPRLDTILLELEKCSNKASGLLGDISVQIEAVLHQSGWKEWSLKVHQISEAFKNIASYLGRFVTSTVSPVRSVDVLNAKMEIIAASDDFNTLNSGFESIRDKVESFLPGISTIQCRAWNEHLSLLEQLSQSTASLADFIANFGSSELSTCKLIAFLESKLTADAAMMNIASMSKCNFIKTWEEYHNVASQRLTIARRLVNLLKPAGVSGTSANGILDGLQAREDCQEIIQNIQDDSTVMNILRDLFNGLDTDLDALTATAIWGASMLRSHHLCESGIFIYLMNSDVAVNYNRASQMLINVVDLSEKLRVKLCDLEEFGDFNWKEWIDLDGGIASVLLKRVESAAGNIDSVLPWSKYINERADCTRIGLNGFITALEKKKLSAESIGQIYEFVVYRSIGRSIYKKYPEIEAFSGESHEKIRSNFVSLDAEIISLTGKSYAFEIDRTKVVPEGDTGYRVSDRTEMQLLRHAINTPKNRLKIRQLMTRAGRAIQALKPCFMMGPMSVAQYLKQGVVEFDMVVMDEASQLRPEDALGAIARGKQLIVVGDPKQLPPTNFFDRLVDDGTDEDGDDAPVILSGSESILDICQQLFHPVRTLRWHYRSQHESLIAFSNFHFYSGKLLVFPSPFKRNNRLGLRYRYVKNGSYKDRQNIPEAQLVVDAVVEHMLQYPGESLGVVTLNQTQRDLIEDLLDKKLRNIAEAQTYVLRWEEEGWPFFVKNLENVQGDERDVIFISTTFGKASGTDKVRQNFGPISRPDGWRRLNVLFTRSRRKIELFTSMLPEDIVLEAKTPLGTKALKEYLDYARRGILVSTDVTCKDADSDFEISVGEMLRNRGFEVVPQLGVAGFFIDLAVRNPDRPGEFLAAIECDGATYHSSNSARDRDRIRQTILESLGWKDRIWRIWSTDWFYNPRRESERLLEFLAKRQVKSSKEIVAYAFEESYEEEAVVVDEEPESITNEYVTQTLFSSTDELYAEVGDLVTYCSVENPAIRHTVMIVDTESNPKLHLINEHTPLAQALLDSVVGDDVEVVVPNTTTNLIRVLKIQRDN